MAANAPHASAAFEGYYSKFDLPSGAHIALILCSIKNAETRPYMLSFTYVPADAQNIFQKEIWPDRLDMIPYGTGNDGAFSLEVPGIGYARWLADDTTEYKIEHEDFTFHGKTISRTPWTKGSPSSTPEGLLVNLPLPLHWHVHSLASACPFGLSIPGYAAFSDIDKKGTSTVHQEKNWAHSFPSAHMWLQARSGESTICCAGGKILGLDAFLLGYRSADLDLDFIPPFAVSIAGVSPFMSYKTDWENRRFELSVQSLRRKITVKAVAPKGTFFPLSAPFPETHRGNFLNQSFKAEVEVRVFESGWTGAWREVKMERFVEASLEFGAGFYPPAGSKTRFH